MDWLVTDNETNKPRGYAFIEYLHTWDMKAAYRQVDGKKLDNRRVLVDAAAYRQADGKKLDNRRVLMDVEHGRTVPNWRPCKLGGGHRRNCCQPRISGASPDFPEGAESKETKTLATSGIVVLSKGWRFVKNIQTTIDLSLSGSVVQVYILAYGDMICCLQR
ncbi:U1 small nuclear ribonucleoprotein-70K [Actinidia rufa]|uniref:U1 small nuclear ribonucleoprotein-70K n=1 Tax=Actinidia rufa TaxID=165716 RepID=A0A7J0GX37_9ERIC|nr:U1 small nuclear ribonucleoprotein-70K [Actinidia rufa]